MNTDLLPSCEQLWEISESLFVMISPAETIIFINRRGCELLGYTKEQLIGKPWFDVFVPAEDRAETKKAFHQIISGNLAPVEYFDNHILTRTGMRRLIHWHNTYLKDDQGHIIATLSSGEDITDKTELEKKLREQERLQQQLVMQSIFETQERERTDIARELHDNVGQILTTCQLLVSESARKQPDPLLLKSHELLQESLHIIRSISHRLKPNFLTEGDLAYCLNELVEQLKLSGRFKVKFAITNAEYLNTLPTEMALNLYRIVQEQTTNIIRYAKATNVRIEIKASRSSIFLVIKDDGVGFNLSQKSKGSGLQNIVSRAQMHGGSVKFVTTPGKGCTLKVLFKGIEKFQMA